ncbi:MAG TPA: hypothetical protein VFG45_11765 [Candidatus Nitrosocosmicus sp.]|nr:hypothetical protein [Candidatus Nitrosocosmicus sp.]
MDNTDKFKQEEYIIRIPINSTEFIERNLTITNHLNKLVIFAHGSGRGRQVYIIKDYMDFSILKVYET